VLSPWSWRLKQYSAPSVLAPQGIEV